MSMIAMTLVTPKVGAEHELLFNKMASAAATACFNAKVMK
jgi:hypothetical protein